MGLKDWGPGSVAELVRFFHGSVCAQGGLGKRHLPRTRSTAVPPIDVGTKLHAFRLPLPCQALCMLSPKSVPRTLWSGLKKWGWGRLAQSTAECPPFCTLPGLQRAAEPAWVGLLLALIGSCCRCPSLGSGARHREQPVPCREGPAWLHVLVGGRRGWLCLCWCPFAAPGGFLGI